MPVWFSHASKFVFFSLGKLLTFLFYLNSCNFTMMCLGAGFSRTDAMFSQQPWDFPRIQNLTLFFIIPSSPSPLYFHFETLDWWALKLWELSSWCLSFSLLLILLQGLPLLRVGRAVVWDPVWAWAWSVFPVWELSVPPEAVSYLGGLCYFFGARAFSCIWTDASQSSIVRKQRSFSSFCLFRDCSGVSGPACTVSPPCTDHPQAFRQQFSGHRSGAVDTAVICSQLLSSEPRWCEQCRMQFFTLLSLCLPGGFVGLRLGISQILHWTSNLLSLFYSLCFFLSMLFHLLSILKELPKFQRYEWHWFLFPWDVTGSSFSF